METIMYGFYNENPNEYLAEDIPVPSSSTTVYMLIPPEDYDARVQEAVNNRLKQHH